MDVQHNISLKPYNTFGMDMPAENIVMLEHIHALGAITDLPYTQRNIVGGGSNILLTQAVPGLTIINKLKGIELLKEDGDHVWLKVSAGEIWHDLVMYGIHNGWAGIENLALIPGTVGAAPIQNIGAYGVEAKETIETVTCWKWDDKTFVDYNNEECQFGYRDSIFKHQLKGQVLITSVTFKLNKKHDFKISYGAIEQELVKMNIDHLSIDAIGHAVINIRTSKLPDPKKIGNAGSFFKNPTIPVSQYNRLKEQHPEILSYPVSEELVKVPAGWLIEQSGWKGYRDGDVGVHPKQALVLVNYATANGNDVWGLSEKIVNSVNEKFGIELEREVQVW
ncbi:MAG: UDP-N-acetylmuramate dehydrogenase [Sphingobacteriales bacterium]|nr:MAG: UDP-N-acetylmuramate dehydrogenase [Sphingobacteriales bacterium]